MENKLINRFVNLARLKFMRNINGRPKNASEIARISGLQYAHTIKISCELEKLRFIKRKLVDKKEREISLTSKGFILRSKMEEIAELVENAEI